MVDAGTIENLVSILVFLDQALKDSAAPVASFLPRVSILVFLDQALKAPSGRWAAGNDICFNPCFPGSSAESEGSSQSAGFPPGFQSLFSWIKR